MKNDLIGFLLVFILVIISLEFKNSQTPVMRNFPANTNSESGLSVDPVLHLLVFFSMNACSSCLESIEVLISLYGRILPQLVKAS